MQTKLALLCSGAPLVHALTVGEIVNTTSGPVRGYAGKDVPSVSVYKGIPFAQPPVGSLRFQSPVRFNGTEMIDAKDYGYACMGILHLAGRGNDIYKYNVSFANLTTQGIETLQQVDQVTGTFSEDCLSINVWAPTGGEANKATMVYFYGGGFTAGSSQVNTYDGQRLASQEDVIIVNFNYRVNNFGFHGNPAATSRNPGFLDQRMAVEWVRDNIAAFGGDPARITLFGQSAGSASIDYYSYAWASDPIAAGFIMESGAAGFGKPPPPNNAEMWYNVSRALGCGDNSSNTTDPDKLLECMQSKSTADIMEAMGSQGFGPTADGVTAFSDYTSLGRAGRFAQIPTLLGNNDFEAGVFIAMDALNNQSFPHEYWEHFSNATFACPAAGRANVSYGAGAPVWRYRWFGNFPNTRLYTDPDSGAYHGSEMPFIFDTQNAGEGIPALTEAEVSITSYMRKAWTTFAKSHDLSNYGGGVAGGAGGGWPQFDPYKATLIRLAYNNVTGPNVAHGIIYDAYCNATYPVAQRSSKGNSSAAASSGSGSQPGRVGLSGAVAFARDVGRVAAVSLLSAVVAVWLI